jgi:AsmA protein
MKTFLKLLGWGIGGVLLVVIVLALILPLLFDANDFKDEIIAQVKQKTGLKLTIEGDIDFSLLPWLGMQLNEVQLDNAPDYNQDIFAKAGQIAMQVKLLPLLQRDIELDTISVQGLLLNLERNQAGEGNWEALMANLSSEQPAQTPSSESSQALSVNQLSINGLDVRDAQILWDDQSTGQRYRIKDFALETSAIQFGQPFTVDSQLQVTTANPPLAAAVVLTGEVNFAPTTQTLTLKDLQLDTDVQAEEPIMAAVLGLSTDSATLNLANQALLIQDLTLAVSDLKAPGMGLSDGQVRLQGVLEGDGRIYRMSTLQLTADLQGDGLPGGNFDLNLSANTQLNLEKETLAVDKLQIDTLGLQLLGNLMGQDLLAQPQFRGALQIEPFNPRQLLTRLGQSAPATSDANALTKSAITTQFSGSSSSVALNPITVQLDDSQLTGKLNIPNLQGPIVRFDLAVDKFNLDRYLPPPAEEATQSPQDSSPTSPGAESISLEPLRQLDVDGELRIGQLTAAKLKTRDIRIPVTAKQGVLTLQPVTAKLYQGALQSGIKLDATQQQPHIAFDNALTGIQAGPLLKDLIGEERLTGTTQLNSQLNWQGIDAATIKRSLNGVSRFSFRDGAVTGVNLGRLVRQAKAALAGQSLPPEQQARAQTDFSELSGSVQFNNGLAKNDDLLAKSPLLRIRGQGTANLVQEQIDYRLTTTVVGTAQGQGGEDLSELSGVPIPIKVTGPLTAPRYALDIAGLLKARTETLVKEKQDELKQEAQGLLQERLKKLDAPGSAKDGETDGQNLEDKAKDALKKLF